MAMKKEKIVTLAISLLLIFGGVSAQQRSISLTVLEKGAEDRIVGANVTYADNKELKDPTHAVTDANGQVRFVLSGKNVCYYRITCLGFTPLTGMFTAGTAPRELYMTQDALGINEVVVTGSHTVRPVKLSPVVTQVISGKAMVDAGYGDIQKVLQQQTPGLNIQKVGFGNEISMQGLDARHVLFLTDGERMTGDMAGNLDYERFNLHAIDRIEIVKGASSTLYGSRASGAVINLITKKPGPSLSIDAGVRYAQMNERNYRDPQKEDFLYMFEKHVDRPNLQSWVSSGWKAGAFGSQTDVWYSESDAFYLYQAENDKKVYTQEANPFLDEDVTIVSRLARPPMGIEGAEHVSVSQKFFFEPFRELKIQVYGSGFWMNQFDMVQDLVFNQSKDYTAGVKATYRLKDWFSVTASLHADYYDRYKRHERRDERQKVYKSRILQPRLTLTSEYFKGHSLIFGVEHFTDELTSDRFAGKGSHKMLSRALEEMEYYAQDEWDMTGRWMLSAGVRTNFSHQFGFMWMPKVAAKYTPDERWSLRANYSMGYRSPGIKELFFNWDHLGMFMVKGNEYLKAEKNNYFSLGAEYADDRFFVNATAYANLFRKKIEGVWRIYDMQYNFEYMNLSSQNLIGGELLARWKMFDYLTLNASYSYVDVSEQDGLRINTTSPHAATGSLEYSLRKKNYTLLAGFSASVMGRKRFDVQDRLTVDGVSHEAYFRCDLPAYALCNLNVTQTFRHKVKFTVGVDNVFDYRPETLGSGLTAFNVPATAGARGYVQVEFMIGEFINGINKKK
jgi:outer membrane receptor for ferrienterochelin and colicin